MTERVDRLILIAEDDTNAIESWERDIKEFNRDDERPIRFHAKYVRTQRQAVAELQHWNMDCAVVDLRMPVDEGGVSSCGEGNAVLETVLAEKGIPTVVYSGYPQEASDLVRASRIRIIKKGLEGGMQVLSWLSGHEGLMVAMAHMRREVQHKAAALFSKTIWPRWESTWNDMHDPSTLPGIITRQVVAHLSEVLSSPPNYHHPEEFYFIPPLEDRLGTGDMIEWDGNVYVVVSPRCNMAHTYPKHILLARCKPMTDEWRNLRKRFTGQDEKDVESATLELRNFATQGHAIASHFLPPNGKEGPWLVQFKDIRGIQCAEAEKLLAGRFATIAPQFVPNLVQRHASYIGRIGQPDLDQDVLRQLICS